MFTDEIGDKLVEVKKYDDAEPIATPEPELNSDDECLNNVENVHYMSPSPTSPIAPVHEKVNLNMKVFGNPHIKKSQSFNTFKPEKTEQSPDCPKNSPLESHTSTPICSPVMVHKSFNPMEGRTKSIEKSQSFSNKLAPIQDENISAGSTFTISKPNRKKLNLFQPEIVLTSPLDSPVIYERSSDLTGNSKSFRCININLHHLQTQRNAKLSTTQNS